ncbi:glycine cleavage system protein GcvH [Methylococcus geothermalis]|uniref:Glycine cleavage system H protein n=1 Tax=Methylococcus geothermalis TaxID=2681310 RepID=A0A858Q594_9GAMM|nr:glycine cleavage system protein GcvH [Methylococcus geothermalis]QJD28963.1 glycine cleavage system protein GcvH [Methylococcus geothermalis]
MSNLPAGLKYAKTHEWARQEPDGTVKVGISDHAQEALGDLVYLELPAIGRRVGAGEACAVVESVKAASDVNSPLSGEIVARNEALTDSPERVNQSPYEAWLFAVKPDDISELDRLLDAEGYRAIAEN